MNKFKTDEERINFYTKVFEELSARHKEVDEITLWGLLKEKGKYQQEYYELCNTLSTCIQ
jgi:hypothetical protein